MRVLVVSDVHANLAALDAVLADAGAFDAVWSLGDTVGYGPYPNECIARLKEYSQAAIPGNHDWGVLGKLDLGDFNVDARQANLWNRGQLTAESRSYLQDLPETRQEGKFFFAHGSPRHPIWEYLFYASTAAVSFDYFRTPFCLVGHTHVPVIFRQQGEDAPARVVPLPEGEAITLDAGRYIVNPGSVGQPRDGDPRAAYMLIDTEAHSFEHRRVEYDIQATQEAMRRVNLPPRLITRLDFGW